MRAVGDVDVVAFTRDATVLGAELRRRTGAQLQVELAPRTIRELDALMDRIAVDDDALTAAGVHVITCGTDPRRGQVRLQVATEDPAAATAWISGRYGPAVALDVLGPHPELETIARIEGYELLDDGRSLRLAFQAGGGVRLLRIEVDEHPDAVTVGAVVLSGYVVTADWRLGFAETRLREPLGSRPLLDAGSGQPVRPSLQR
jgi:hypothetical protein